MRRRNFLKGVASALALASVSTKKKKPAPDLIFNRNLISVLLGPAFDGHAEFSIVHSQPKTLRYLVFQREIVLQESHYTTVKSDFDDFKIDKFQFKNLPIDTDLKLKIYDGHRLIDERVFRSIPSSRTTYNIGLLSCMRAAQHEKSMWTSLESQDADLLLFLGDCIYIDYEIDQPITLNIIWKKFVETRMVLEVYHWKRLVPVIAIWDDHDFGGNNSNSRFPLKRESQENFKNFFAQNLSESNFISAGPGISCKFQLGNQLFLMLDGRSFREPPGSGMLNSFFGKEQEDWIFESIKNFDGLVWMNNGTQWFNDKSLGESFRKDHSKNFDHFVEKLNLAGTKVLFTSGDVHFSEVCQTPPYIKNKSFELTSSCMHSSNFMGIPTLMRSEGRIASTWKLNYLICRTMQLESKLALDIRCFTRDTKKQFGIKTDFHLA